MIRAMWMRPDCIQMTLHLYAICEISYDTFHPFPRIVCFTFVMLCCADASGWIFRYFSSFLRSFFIARMPISNLRIYSAQDLKH